MVIQPMIRNNVCLNAHPVGCAKYVEREVAYVDNAGPVSGPKSALIIGGSAGYGLATRIVAAFGAKTPTVAVAFEKPATGKRTATVGWYNTAAFEKEAVRRGVEARTIYGDAFSHEIKRQTVETIKEELGTVDLVVYSLASGLRIDPDTGEQYRSALKPTGSSYTAKSLDPMTGAVSEATIEPATEEEAAATVKVMGGEDWELWIRALKDGGVLAEGAMTVAYSYVGPEVTQPIYRDGTIGKAKEHLESTASTLTDALSDIGGRAYVSVNKAVVTRASAVIPVVPLYFAILFQVMKEKGLHEGPIEQMYRLFKEQLYSDEGPRTDDEGRIRMDDWEMRDDVQEEVARRWKIVNESNVSELSDLDSYRNEFLRIHGFGLDEVDYNADVEP